MECTRSLLTWSPQLCDLLQRHVIQSESVVGCECSWPLTWTTEVTAQVFIRWNKTVIHKMSVLLGGVWEMLQGTLIGWEGCLMAAIVLPVKCQGDSDWHKRTTFSYQKWALPELIWQGRATFSSQKWSRVDSLASEIGPAAFSSSRLAFDQDHYWHNSIPNPPWPPHRCSWEGSQNSQCK